MACSTQKDSPGFSSLSWVDFFSFLSSLDMDQQDKQAKPRKRFVGKARNQEATTADPNSIEDGAVGFASKLLLP